MGFWKCYLLVTKHNPMANGVRGAWCLHLICITSLLSTHYAQLLYFPPAFFFFFCIGGFLVMRICLNLLVVSLTWDKPVSIGHEP
jgi:hypothetical protein